MFDTDEYFEDSTPGTAAAIAALVLALDEKGILSRRNYSDVLCHLWDKMPETEAVGEPGAIIGQILNLVNAADDSGSMESREAGAPPEEAALLRVA